MSVELFESVSLVVCISGLIAYMCFVMYKLASESKAGKFGTIAIFGTLGLGIIGFVVKEVLTLVMNV